MKMPICPVDWRINCSATLGGKSSAGALASADLRRRVESGKQNPNSSPLSSTKVRIVADFLRKYAGILHYYIDGRQCPAVEEEPS
jgi:hypothetical protein